MWAVDDQARAAWQRLKMPEVEYVDGFNVPNYEKRDPAPKYQMPMTAADSQKFIQTPAEFKVELFAQEPMLGGKPITFSFDERGRLWVIEAVDYPNRVLRGGPGRRPHPDPRGHQRRRQAPTSSTVFADHLNLATSLVFANGGVIVAAAPHMLFLQDTNGDDKADVKKVISTGWGIADTHAGPVEPALRAGQLRLGRGRLLRLRRRDERQADEVPPGRLPLQAGRLAVRVHHRIDQQHVGPRHSRDLRRVRLDRQQRSQLLRRHPQPLLRGACPS